MNKNIIHIQHYFSPCGELILGSYDNKLCLCDWANEKHRDKVLMRLKKTLNAVCEPTPDDTLINASSQLDGYFAKQRTEFDMPLLFVGTEFQKKVWQALTSIPYGTTVSYATVAKQISMPTAVRAVANANGANAISVFVPCHRVIGSDNTLTGYGGGLDTKLYLLQLEGNFSLF
ncbi:MAG: methylated-DNA--[protein]-cysteine S-methyltransferase [Bacteroidales bacterium]|nr:methylated-DNA--[protein]-cysteine S-methyltransferase [Bacteroidales bacterium]